jgi:hypothetical protein
VKSITLDGQDISEALLDVSGHASVDGVIITMTDRLTSVSGIVTDGRGSPARDYVAVVLRADERESPSGIRFVRTARPDTNGQFEVRALRPGRYVAAAVEWLEQGRQFSPEFQRQLRRGAREFTLGEGEALKIELTTISGQ